MPATRKAELIGMSCTDARSPIRIEHQVADGAVLLVGAYGINTTRAICGDGSAIDIDNEAHRRRRCASRQSNGGQSSVSADGFIEGAPELVVEISGSSARMTCTPR